MEGSYNYDYKQILKSALNKQTINNNINTYAPFANDDTYAPFASECTNPVIDFTKGTYGSDIYEPDLNIYEPDLNIYEPDLNIYDELENNNEVVNNNDEVVVNNNDEIVVNIDEVVVNNNDNLQSCYSLKDNYENINNNFKEVAEKILLDNNCDEDKLNIEVSKYDDYLKNKNTNEDINTNNNNFDNIIHIINIKKEATDKIKLYNIEINATEMLISKIKDIMDNLNIKNCTKDEKIEEKIINNISNVIYYNTCFKLSIHLVNQKKEIQNNIDDEQLKINAILYLLMKNKWLNITTHVHKLLIN